jgi:chemotaxis protein MotB
MARKRRQIEPENHERWLVSYADFITLLFAFFVVMYSISSVNDGKYRVLSNTLTDAFVAPAQSADPIQIGEEVRTMIPGEGEYASPEVEVEPEATDKSLDSDQTEEGAAEEDAAQNEQQPLPEPESEPLFPSTDETIINLQSALDPFIDQNLVNIVKTERGIEVEMRSKMLFDSGSARLSRDAVAALRNVTAIISPLPNQIQVEGHTDNVPIQTVAFPSNWELSAARAASVVHLFTRLGVNATRMSAIGYGEYQTVGDNRSEEGRQKNRRVAIIILTEPQRGRGGGRR